MPKKKLFDEDSDEEVSLKTENAYAKRYDAWREKEEVHKLEQKYGSKALNSDASESSDSEDESDEPLEVSEEVETQFLKTLSLLKTKDPRIYDPGYKCFEEKVEKEKEKKPAVKSLTFVDSDEDDDDDTNIFSIEKKAEIDHSDNEVKTNNTSKEDKLKEYLTGKAEHLDTQIEKDLAPLRALWSDPKLNDGEAFLRDYILNKRYLGDGDGGAEKVRDDEELEEDSRRVEEQGQFERAYNFRFEEPDQEYLKRFPRTMNFIRPKDDSRSRKRAEVRARKEEEKKKKMDEIARLRAFKLKEIQEKIAKIKEVTGNQDLAFKDEDIEGDFDPEEHDARMRALFDDQYYGGGDDHKPACPDLDRELDIENWEDFEVEQDNGQENDAEEGPHCEDDDFNMDADYDPKKAREGLLEELQRSLAKPRRSRKRKSKLAQLLARAPPTFTAAGGARGAYARFMDEYYRMDAEDELAGLPTRFKYRQVVPNDYGLTVEEILLADDKELTQWAPLKRLMKYRGEAAERGDVNAYRQKAADAALKKKVLPSLFRHLDEKPEIVVPTEDEKKNKKKKNKSSSKEAEHMEMTENNDVTNNSEGNPDSTGDEIQAAEELKLDDKQSESKNKRKKKKGKNKKSRETQQNVEGRENKESKNISEDPKINGLLKPDKCNQEEDVKKKIKNKRTKEVKQNIVEKDELSSVQIQKQKNLHTAQIPQQSNQNNNNMKRKKNKNGFIVENVKHTMPSQISENDEKLINNRDFKSKNSLKRKLKNSETNHVPNKIKKTNLANTTSNKKNKSKQKKFPQHEKDKIDNPLSKLSDERLKAYGLNPKKYRSFLKYKKF